MDVYNKRRNDDDFLPGPEGDQQYDEYLEDIEDMIMVLSNALASDEEKNKVRKKVKAEKQNAQNA